VGGEGRAPPSDTPAWCPLGPTSPPPAPGDYRLTGCARVFELNELCGLFLGPQGQRLYEGSLCLYVYSSLWLYASIIGTTVVSIVPIPNLTHYLQCDSYSHAFPTECVRGYHIWLFAFCLALLPICLVDISALARVQVVLNVAGYCCIATMIVSVVAAMFLVPSIGPDPPPAPPYIRHSPLVRVEGFGILFATTVFTQLGHWAVPSIIQVMADKEQAPRVLRSAFSFTCSLYALLSALCVLYFGDAVLPTVTLNWRDFTLLPNGRRPPWVQGVNTAVVAVPVLTILCVIPMFVHTLANNLLAAVPLGARGRLMGPDLEPSAWPPYRCKVGARLLVLVPPFALAFVERDASAIIAFCGLFGFALMFFIPAFLQLVSSRTFQRLWPSASPSALRTPFSGTLSAPWAVWILLAAAAVGFAFNVESVVRHLLQGT
jgi:hypothetical protein